MSILIPDDVKFIIDTFYNNGYEAFMVGGCIRDSLLNKTPMDYDIATSAPPEITQSLFSKTVPTGIEHGTITVLVDKVPYEVTTYRIEGKYSDNRKPDKVTFISNIKEDLARRDFTINAFAYNDKTGLLDYFSGIDDLTNKIIKCVGNPDKRFKEDALRMLRAIRFSSQLDFNIDTETYSAISANSKLIKHISNERIRIEFSKTLLSNNPFAGMTKLINTNLLNEIIPYSLNINSTLDKINKTLSSRLAFLFINLDLSLTSKVLKDLTFDNNTINKTITLISSYKLLGSVSSKSDCKRLIIHSGIDTIFELYNLSEAIDKTDLSKLISMTHEILDNNDVLFMKDLSIDGNTLITKLNIKPGKIIGEILSYLLNMIIDEKISNNEEDLLIRAKSYYRTKNSDN